MTKRGRLQIGERVQDSRYGIGTVVKEKNQFGYVTVRFDSGVERQINAHRLERVPSAEGLAQGSSQIERPEYV